MQRQTTVSKSATEEILASSGHTGIARSIASPQITLEHRPGKGLNVTIESARLAIASVVRSDAREYHEHLFSDDQVMQKFSTGKAHDRSYVEARLDLWCKRWESGDPLSALVIRAKTGEFIGHIALSHGHLPGHAALAYALRSDMWGQGFGGEAVQAVVKGLTPLLRAYGFSVDGRPVSILSAIIQPDNLASSKILEGTGMQVIARGENIGALQEYFQGSIPLPDPSTCWEICVYPDTTNTIERA